MSYNVDPDRWYESELSIIHSKYYDGAMTRKERDRAIDELDRKYKDMWDRLDGSYQIPK